MKDLQSTKIRVKSIDETLKLGEIIGKSLKSGSIIALKGELGAGKTVLVKGIAKGLGVEEEPNSPTFVIMNCYEGRLPLFHFDLYRVADEGELIAMGYDEFFFGGGVSVVEWADRVPAIFPEDAIAICIKIPEGPDGEPENTREIDIKGIKEWVLSFKNMAEQASLI